MNLRRSIAAFLATALCAIPAAASGDAGSGTSAVGPASLQGVAVATGLDFPSAFTVAPDGRIFYGELNTGEVRVFNPGSGLDVSFFQVPDLLDDGERGLLGLALHPDFPVKPYLFLYVTRDVAGTPTNQVVRVAEKDGVGVNLRVVFSSNAPSDLRHNGGRILVGPDDRLYVAIGDAEESANAQDMASHAGKILRMSLSGKIPASNPYPDSYVFSYGHRNAFGFAFDDQTQLLWEAENGPACNDEVNLVLPATNYGWGPAWTCNTPPSAPMNTNRDGAGPELPLLWYTPTIAPTGAVFCDACGLTGGHGKLYFGAVNTGEIRRVTLHADRLRVAAEEIVYTHPMGVLSMERGPDGRIYFSSFDGIYELVDG